MKKLLKILNDIDKIESLEIMLVNIIFKIKLLFTLNNSENVDIDKIKRNFLTNSSCGVCGKTSLDSLEIIKKDKVLKSLPKISKEIIIKSPSVLRDNQSEFSKTGGIHASGLFTSDGGIVCVKEDVGRHNALDKLIGYSLNKGLLTPSSQFITCSGRLNFELSSKGFNDQYWYSNWSWCAN